MKRLVFVILFVFFVVGTTHANVYLYVDAAPNVYGSSDYDPWKNDAFNKAVSDNFTNMANSYDPANIGTTDFHIRDEVVYSFGDLGKRLTWIYWVPDTTIGDLTDNFKIKLENWWDGEYLDFYDDQYGSTWLEPTKWEEYEGGVIGTAGMAWWGAYQVDTQEALEADIADWKTSDETWMFTAQLDGTNYSITSNRAAVPVPAAVWLLGSGLVGLVGLRRKIKS